MELTVLMVAGCPHAALLEERLAAALRGAPVTVTRRVITDPAEAAPAGLNGSPTLLLDGSDPFAAPGQPASMSCRLYDNGARPAGRRAVGQPAPAGDGAARRPVRRAAGGGRSMRSADPVSWWGGGAF